MIEDYTRRIAEALDVRGLINVQYAVKANQVFVIEANPRASRTVPFVAKATGVPLAKVAARVMIGATLAELRDEGLLVPRVVGDHIAVKEAVLPFARFPEADALLGPEMRSTGEVMGIDLTVGLAFAKSQLAAGSRLPEKGTVFLSLADRDKATGVRAAERFAELGFEIAATSGTAAHLREHGIEVATVVAKLGEPDRHRRGRAHRQRQGAARRQQPARPRPAGRRRPHPHRGRGQPRAAAHHRGRRPGRGQRHGRLGAPPAAGAQPAGVPPGHPGRPARGELTGWRRPGAGAGRWRMTTQVGSVTLANPVMTASGTAGHGDELARYVDLSSLGAVVVKSLSAEPWPGNPPPRVHETQGGMLNSVGLQGPGVEAWLRDELPPLLATGATVVASIWGRTVEEYAAAAAPARRRAGRRWWRSRSTSAARTSTTVGPCSPSCPTRRPRRSPPPRRAVGPRWAKLSPMVADLVPIAAAARDAGAEAVTLVNTVLGLAIDTDTRLLRLGGGGGGLSGPAIHPIAVRAVHDVHVALPDLPIVGVGGVTRGVDAVELMMAGASAVQVGTATFADPRSVGRVAVDVATWCRRHGVAEVTELIGVARAR